MARMTAAAAWVCTRWVSVISTSTSPASCSASSNPVRVSAPAMQPVHRCMSAPAQHPAASRSTVGLSAARLITQLEMLFRYDEQPDLDVDTDRD